jgi:hypothetical protein
MVGECRVVVGIAMSRVLGGECSCWSLELRMGGRDLRGGM